MAFLAAVVIRADHHHGRDVKGADGKPVENAQIKMIRTDIKGNYKTKTNKKGHYIYMGLPMGTYDIRCSSKTNRWTERGRVRTKPGDPIPVNFDLKAQQASKEEMQKAMESGTMTKEMERGLTAEQKAQMEKELKERRKR